MAGDLKIKEQVVVFEPKARRTGARAARSIRDKGGRVMHRFGPRVMVMEAPEEKEDLIKDSVKGAFFSPTPSEVPSSMKQDLDPTGLLGYEAIKLRQDKAYIQAKADRPLAGEIWDTASAQRPDAIIIEGPSGDAVFTAPSVAMAPSPTSAFLIGSVAVGLIIVEGPTNDLKFSDEDRTKVVAEVQNGLSWLGTLEPKANLSWSYDIQIATLQTPPGQTNLSPLDMELHWRNPAMAELGYGPGANGVTAYVQDLRSKLHTRWGYCAFFTKYPVGHFAYASLGGPRLVMQFANDGWGPDNIDRVFTHETGHIFGAPDEYPSSGCTCGGQWGYLRTPNGNCANCAEGGGVPCIMRSNEWAICDFTRTHYGWRDQDDDGILDPDDPVHNPRWWLFRWLCRRYPQLCRFLRVPQAEEEEDLVPMSLLAQVLDKDDLERIEERIKNEQQTYLETVAQRVKEAFSDLRSTIR